MSLGVQNNDLVPARHSRRNNDATLSARTPTHQGSGLSVEILDRATDAFTVCEGFSGYWHDFSVASPTGRTCPGLIMREIKKGQSTPPAQLRLR